MIHRCMPLRRTRASEWWHTQETNTRILKFKVSVFIPKHDRKRTTPTANNIPTYICCTHRYCKRQYVYTYERAPTADYAPSLLYMTKIKMSYMKPVIYLHRYKVHCNTLQHTATHCNTLQHTTTHCNTLQHTAIHVIYLLCYKVHMTKMNTYSHIQYVFTYSIRINRPTVLPSQWKGSTCLHARERNGTHMYEPRHTYVWATSHICMSHVTHMY